MALAHSPDSFMFQSFEEHSRIFRLGNIGEYFMLSSGTNQFPMPKLWKDCMVEELKSDFMYRWYTDSKGFQAAAASIKIMEDFLAYVDPANYRHSDRGVCMMQGGCGAAASAFEYLKVKYENCRVILVGRNYSLYERLARAQGFPVVEMFNSRDDFLLPQKEDFQRLPEYSEKPVFVFSVPNNPTGESHTEAEFRGIMGELARRGGYLVLDSVCNFIISSAPHDYFQRIISQMDYWADCVVINSYSKTDSAAGLRLGYLYGDREIIDFCAKLNANTCMNPATYPVLPIVLTSLFRCLYLLSCHRLESQGKYWIRRFKKVLFLTAAIIPPALKRYINHLFDNLDLYCQRYVNEILLNEKKIRLNYWHTCNILAKHIRHVSRLTGSFNFCVWFNREFRLDEIELIRGLIEDTGVAILTESSFSLRKARSDKFMMRFSAACEPHAYLRALLSLKEFLETKGFAE